jgi:glycosyltransferase involved in cell wall biosynthesis
VEDDSESTRTTEYFKVKILLVTFPNDLGSRTIEANLLGFIAKFADVTIFRFAAQDANRIDKQIDNRRNLLRRFQDALKLRAAVRQGVRDGRKILFYNISPALFAYGSWRGGEAYITLDWARRLLAKPNSKNRDPMIHLHRLVLRACNKILPMTDAMEQCLWRDYGIPRDRTHRIPSLFDVDYFDPGEIRESSRLRLLFVGGDVIRKGGDLLHSAFCERLSDICSLTMVTNVDLPPHPGLTLLKGIRYGTPEHLSIMRDHDIFVLPTREDAGPQVIGEAAAAGLAVFTTQYALGAPHVIKNGITGIIAESPEDCIERLVECIKNRTGILEMRKHALIHMRNHFSSEAIVSAISQGME